jgi:hypothetical protein
MILYFLAADQRFNLRICGSISHMKKTGYSLFHWCRSHLELLFWTIALAILFFLPENVPAASLCFFSLLGFDHCPGCGIGHAIHYALRLQPQASFAHHPLGIIAVIIIFMRVKSLHSQTNHPYETQPDQPDPLH